MHLRVATLNVWGLPAPLSVEPIRRLHAIGERLASLPIDVAAFQEVWFPDARRILIEAGRRAGLAHAWSPGRGFGESGLLVLSRLPIDAASLTPFALRGSPERVTQGEYYGGKGYVRLELRTPVGPVQLVDTHLHARYSSDVAHAYIARRSGQVVQLALGTRDIGDPLIVAGDFNFTRKGREFEVLTGLSGLRDLAHEAGRAEPTVLRSNPFRHSHKPDHRVDYVFARDGREARVRTLSVRRIFDERIPDALACSNHAGVLAELSIEPTRATRTWHASTRSIQLARGLLSAGRTAAVRRRAEQRAVTGAGMGMALLAAVGDRGLVASRRRFLRTTLQLAAASALAPSVGCSFLSEMFVPDEIHAYERLDAALRRLRTARIGTWPRRSPPAVS